MKKEDVLSLIIYMVMIGFAILVGMTAVSKAFIEIYSSQFMNRIAFCVLVLIGSVVLNIGGLELFHVLGAKIGGYKAYSVNILGLCWTKKEGKWKFTTKDYDGLTGETKVAPVKEKCQYHWYIYLPLIMYFFELALGLVFYSMGLKATSSTPNAFRWISVASLLNVIVSSMIALYNFVPLKLDSMTDGYRLMLLTNKTNKEALNEILRIEALQNEGKEVDKIKIFDEITDFTANINLHAIYDCLANKDYEKACELIQKIFDNPQKVQEITLNRITAQYIYIKVLTLDRKEAKEYYNSLNDNIRRFISNDKSMESLRAYVLIAGLLDKSQGEVKYAMSKKDKILKNTSSTRASIESKLFEEAIQMIKNEHPDWELEEGAK